MYDRFQDVVTEGDMEAYKDLELPDPSKKEVERFISRFFFFFAQEKR